MSEQASEVKAWWMSARRSQRMVRRRRRASQASVRSSTQRCRPRRSERSTPRRAMRGVMGRSRHSARHRRWSQALSAWSLRGRRRGRPRPRRTPGTTSRTAASIGLVVAVGPARASKPSGVPWASTTRWRLRSPACPGPLGSARSSCAATSAPFCGTGRGSSIEARLQSSASAAASRSRKHPMQRAQHAGAMPVAQPAPARHAGAAERLAGQPLPADARPRATNTMPSRACRSSHRGRPPFGFGGSGGSRGSTAAHNSSLTRGPVITPNAARPDGCCQGL